MSENGAEIWRGISAIDDKTEIVVLLVGLEGSRNAKTGNMLQTYILVADKHPKAAIEDRSDAAICGDCRYRGTTRTRTCYVNMATGLASVGRVYRRGEYKRVDISKIGPLVQGRGVRIGTYGDPAAVSVEVWKWITKWAVFWTGYTHQWRHADQRLRRILMASVDSPEEQWDAIRMGWRTFRVRQMDALTGPEEVMQGELQREIVCPASHEAGRKSTCYQCQMCSGRQVYSRLPHVCIINHHRASIDKVRAYDPKQVRLNIV